MDGPCRTSLCDLQLQPNDVIDCTAAFLVLLLRVIGKLLRFVFSAAVKLTFAHTA